MEKKKDELKEEKKVPFNAFRKGAAALALAGVMLATPFMVTGCSDDKTEPEETTQETQDETKYIVDVDVVYEQDNRGELWAIYTYTYSDGSTSEERVVVPKKIKAVEGLCFADGQVLNKLVKSENKTSVPKLYVSVRFDDETIGKVELKEDMFINNQSAGYVVPDFTKKGNYNYQVSYKGKQGGGALEIVDLADYTSNTITSVRLTDSSILAGTELKDITVSIRYQDSTTIYAPLTLVANKYEDDDTYELLDTIDTSVPGSYSIKPKDAFKFKADPGDSEYVEYFDTLYIYSRDCTISNIYVTDLTFTPGTENFESVFKAKTFTADLFEEDEKGQLGFSGKVEDLNYDLSHVNINKVGQYPVPFTYQMEGQTGVYSSELTVTVAFDLSASSPTATYTTSKAAGGLFAFSPCDKVELHDVSFGGGTVKVALMYNSVWGKNNYSMQAEYELIDEGATIKLFDSMMNAYTFYDVDGSDIEAYTKASGTPTNYTGRIEMMEDMYNIKLAVHGTTGACKALVTVTMDIGEGEQDYPYAYVECTWVDGDTIEFAGRTFNVTTGNVLVEVTE